MCPGVVHGDDPRMRATTRLSPPNRGLVRKQDTTLSRIGGWCFDHRMAAVGIWLVGLAAVLGAAGAIGPAYDAVLDLPDSDSADGFAVLDEHFAELGAGTHRLSTTPA